MPVADRERLIVSDAASPGRSTVRPPAARRNSRFLAAAGIVILFVGLGAALLPVLDPLATAQIIGGMMIVAGAVEAAAGTLRRRNGLASLFPGLVTILAGALFATGRFDNFLAAVQLVIGWLALRSAVLLLAGFEVSSRVRYWTFVSAGSDLALAAIFFAGLSASTFSIALFGLSLDVVRGFAVVLAVSFVTTAMLLIEIAASESGTEGRGESPHPA